jgi:hypothetical protein
MSTTENADNAKPTREQPEERPVAAGTGDNVIGPAAAPEPDPRLVAATDDARAAAADEAGGEHIGEHVDLQAEDGAVTHLFEARLPGYRGWRWAVTVAHAGEDTPVTISEVVLLPGPDALIGQEWVPWSERVQAGDLGVGDVVLTPADDVRLVPGYLASDDEAVEELAHEVGLGRKRVLSREGRIEAAERWRTGEYGPRSDMARGAAEHCGTCGFYLPVAGSLRAAFGVCGNEIAPADGHVVHAEYGCGAHSEVDVDSSPAVPVAELVYDDAGLDVERQAQAEGSAQADDAAQAEGSEQPEQEPAPAES